MIGLIDGSGKYEISNVGSSYHCTLSLTSSAPSRKIELSINDGADYFVPQYDVDETGVIGLAVRAPITNIRFTGAQGDEWGVLE